MLFLTLSCAAISRKPFSNLMTFSLCRVSSSRLIAQGHLAVTCLTSREPHFEDHDGSWQQGQGSGLARPPRACKHSPHPSAKTRSLITHAGLLLCFSAQCSCPAQVSSLLQSATTSNGHTHSPVHSRTTRTNCAPNILPSGLQILALSGYTYH